MYAQEATCSGTASFYLGDRASVTTLTPTGDQSPLKYIATPPPPTMIHVVEGTPGSQPQSVELPYGAEEAGCPTEVVHVPGVNRMASPTPGNRLGEVHERDGLAWTHYGPGVV